MSRTSATSRDEVKDLLSRQLDSKLTVADALSFLLFDYVVEQKAAQVMGKLDLSGPDPFGRNGFATVIPVKRLGPQCVSQPITRPHGLNEACIAEIGRANV